MAQAHVQAINLESASDTVFFFIHGYTGSPTDFNELPAYLHDTYGVGVKVMLLPGHGTTIQDLDYVQYQDFYHHVEGRLQAELAQGRKVILGGVSFGALLAMVLAGRYNVQGVVTVCLPYRLKFPFNVPGVGLLRYYKKYWRKRILPQEEQLRQKSFRYLEMHINGLRLVRQARRDVDRAVSQVTCPVLFVHSLYDPIGELEGVHELIARLTAPCDVFILDNPNHNIFYSEKRFDLYRRIEEFFALTAPAVEVTEKAGLEPELASQAA